MKLIDGRLFIEEVVAKISTESVEATPESNGDVTIKIPVSEQLVPCSQYEKFNDKTFIVHRSSCTEGQE